MKQKHFGLQGPRILAAVILAVATILITFLRFRSVIPTGVVNVQIVLPLLLSCFLVFGDRLGTITFFVVVIIAMLLGTIHWQDIISWLIAIVIVILIEHRRFENELVLSHRTLILLGLSAGLTQLVAILIIYSLTGFFFDGAAGMRIFASQTLPAALFNGLLTTLLTAPLSIFSRWLMRKMIN